jgi:small conductance mechanosensitive channel
MEKLEGYLGDAKGLIITYGGKIVLAIIVLIIGLWLIKKIVNIIGKRLDKQDVDPSLKPFLLAIIGGLLKIMLFITILSMIGVEMTSFIAVLGAAGLAIGLALQGSLANFAGGVLIILLKPFKVGDFIDTGSHSGTVNEIQVFYTYMTTTSKQEIIIPNGELSNNAIKNYSYHDTRRLDMTFGIGYEDDIDKAKGILEGLVQDDERFMKEPAHDIFVEALADSSVNIHVRAWLTSENFWGVANNLNEKVKKAFDAEGINIPFPQRDVHMIKE